MKGKGRKRVRKKGSKGQEENLREKIKSGRMIKEKKEGKQRMEKAQLRLKKLNISSLSERKGRV